MNQSFNEWLAGVIDGDGCFLLSKKGYASLEITMDIRDKHCLYLIKQKFGGSIKIKAPKGRREQRTSKARLCRPPCPGGSTEAKGAPYLRYRLHHRKGLLDLIHSVNGNIRNPTRVVQMHKICDKYEIPLLYADSLSLENGWLSGMIDSDGSVYLNLQSDQIVISIAQKNKLLLDPLLPIYGGSIYIQKQTQAFKWVVFRKEQLLALLKYFQCYAPLRSAKKNRVFLIPQYFLLRKLKAHLASTNSVEGKQWAIFLKKWNYYE
jgi:hypothetical protein